MSAGPRRWLGDAWADALAIPRGAGRHGPPRPPRPVSALRPDLLRRVGARRGHDRRGQGGGDLAARTRVGARFQCAVLHEWDPRRLVELLALSADEREVLVADLACSGVGIGPVRPEWVRVAALLARSASTPDPPSPADHRPAPRPVVVSTSARPGLACSPPPRHHDGPPPQLW